VLSPREVPPASGPDLSVARVVAAPLACPSGEAPAILVILDTTRTQASAIDSDVGTLKARLAAVSREYREAEDTRR
jgi:hypothetical protein